MTPSNIIRLLAKYRDSKGLWTWQSLQILGDRDFVEVLDWAQGAAADDESDIASMAELAMAALALEARSLGRGEIDVDQSTLVQGFRAAIQAVELERRRREKGGVASS